jgi:hypothetical protein
MSSIIKIAVILPCLVKTLLIPMTLLTALGITVMSPVVEEVFQMEDILERF